MIILRNSQYLPKFLVSYEKYVYGDILDRGYLVEIFPLKQMQFTRIFCIRNYEFGPVPQVRYLVYFADGMSTPSRVPFLTLYRRRQFS